MSRVPTLLVHGMYEDEIVVSKTVREQSWQAFLREGSTHSARAYILPWLIRRCEMEGISYRLTASPGLGYHMDPLEKQT